MSKPLRTAAIWILALVVLCGLLRMDVESLETRSIAALDEDVAAGRVVGVRLVDEGIEVTRDDGSRYLALGVVSEETWAELDRRQIPLAWEEPWSWVSTGVTGLLVVVVLVAAVVVYLRRQATQGGGMGSIFELRKSLARQVKPGEVVVRFSDVAGADEVKARLGDVIDYLKHPERWRRAGARPPRGILLDGPPGCGKTLIARAVAGEAGVACFVLSASEFVEMFVGVGAARVRDLFENAKKAAPSVIFIDELDAVGRRRGAGLGSSHDEREQTLNQLLVCLDGFERDTRVVVIAATNRVDVLDRALLRPGRFDLHIVVPPLDSAARLAALQIHTRDKSLSAEVDLPGVAARCVGMTGADLEQLSNEAALAAVRRSRGSNAEVQIIPADIDVALAPLQSREHTFNAVDALLLESASQLARPTAPTRVRVSTQTDEEIEGEILWADAVWLKLSGPDGPRLIPKSQVRGIVALAGTAEVSDVSPDLWAGRRAGTA